MKKLIILCLALVLALSIVGCDKEETDGKIAGFDPAKMFQATILEITDNGLIVEPSEGYSEAKSSNKISVSTTNLDLDDEFKVGDTVEIYYEGVIQETYPAVATKVVFVKKVD